MDFIKDYLFSVKEENYKNFSAKLNPAISPDKILGVRTPILKAYAKKLFKEEKYISFINTLPHNYFEEDNLHAFIVSLIPNFELCIAETEKFLPLIDNWATCDGLRPNIFKKNKEKLLFYIDKWLESSHTYTVRFGISMLMCHFLDEDFKSEYLEKVSKIKSDEYYINMMIAWFFATALSKKWDETLPYLENKVLEIWVHKKTISKAIDSYRITKEQKEYLKTLR